MPSEGRIGKPQEADTRVDETAEPRLMRKMT
jgi:hypothetical protein